MPQERTFYAPNVDLESLAGELERWLKVREFQTQVVPVEDGGIVVQARQEEGWKAAIGLSLAVNVVITPTGESIRVQTGQGKWVDKAVVGAVGLLLLWPALVPAAIGVWKQSKLPEEIFGKVSEYLARQPKELAEPKELRCPSCNQVMKEGAKFCERCGSLLAQEPEEGQTKHCANCGAEMPATAKFCPECGTSVKS